MIADIAIMMSGHVSVPFYPTLTAEQLHQVVEHSECRVLFVGKLDDWTGMKAGVPTGVYQIGFPNNQFDSALLSWTELVNTHAPMVESPLPELDDLFTIVYTSGTTGMPKGVMVDYRAVAAVAIVGQTTMHYDTPNPRFFSYLPLCHLAERDVVELVGLFMGGTIYFAESLDTFARNLVAASPTHFLSVPRIWLKFQQGILAKMPASRLNMLLRIPLLSNVVKRKIRQGLGLDNAVVTISGAAPMPLSLVRWFRRLGIVIQDAYGMTENMGVISIMPPHQIKDGTVGRVYPGVNIRIDPETGEILTQAPWNMRGYYRNPELTAETLSADNWLRTGDVGDIDDDGYLRITGRVKEMYKSQKGEYIAPAPIEFGFADNTYIDQICITGRHLPQPIALVVLAETARQTARTELAKSLTQTINELNLRLQTYERVKKVVVVKDAWTVDNNLMTPTMKIKRNVVEARYEPQMPHWYEQGDLVVWEQ